MLKTGIRNRSRTELALVIRQNRDSRDPETATVRNSVPVMVQATSRRMAPESEMPNKNEVLKILPDDQAEVVAVEEAEEVNSTEGQLPLFFKHRAKS
jgi:hypothetical protein